MKTKKPCQGVVEASVVDAQPGTRRLLDECGSVSFEDVVGSGLDDERQKAGQIGEQRRGAIGEVVGAPMTAE
jgi:hypothetical protein